MDGPGRLPAEDHLDKGVPRGPGIGKALPSPGAEQVVELVLEGVERLTQRRAPLLVPVAAHLAAAVGAPAFDPVDAAPRALLVDLDFPFGGVQLEELAVVGQPHVGVLRQAMQHVSQGHVAVGVMVPVRFAVSSDVHELGMFAAGVEPVEEPLQEAVAVIEQPLEGDLMSDDAVEEEQDDRASRGKAAEVGPRGINAAGDLDPVLLAELAPPPSLRGRQDREVNAGLGQDFQRLHVDGRLGQPHSLGITAEAMPEIGDAPEHLGLLVPGAGQGQDHVVVDLGERIAMPPPPLLAQPVGLDNARQSLRGGVGHPLQERGAEVEADPGVVVQEVDDSPLAVEQSGPGVGSVALVGDPLVPVVKRGRRVLHLDNPQPRVLAGGLVEVPMDADISGLAHAGARFWSRVRRLHYRPKRPLPSHQIAGRQRSDFIRAARWGESRRRPDGRREHGQIAHGGRGILGQGALVLLHNQRGTRAGMRGADHGQSDRGIPTRRHR